MDEVHRIHSSGSGAQDAPDIHDTFPHMNIRHPSNRVFGNIVTNVCGIFENECRSERWSQTIDNHTLEYLLDLSLGPTIYRARCQISDSSEMKF